MLNARATFRFFTTFGGVASENAPANVSILCFPLVGLVLGGFLLLVHRLVGPYLHSEILAAVMAVVIILATGGRYMNGIYETFNALAGNSMFADAVRRQQVYGILAVLLVVLFKIKSIEVLGENRGLSLLLSPLMARWSLVLFLFGSTTAADDCDLQLGDNVHSWHVIVATAATLGFGVYYAGAQILWVSLCLSLFALLARGYLQRREGGVSLANCGALIELSEALSFTLFASL